MIQRLGAQQDRLFGDQKEFVYFAPGAVRIAEKSSAPVKNRAHTIETQIDLKGDEEGVIVAVGGMTGGYTMFIKDNELYYDYNFLDGVHYVLKSGPLPKGKTELKFNFIKTQRIRRRRRTYRQWRESRRNRDAANAYQHLLAGGDIRCRNGHGYAGFEDVHRPVRI